jgi:phytoene desaturase
VKKAVVIGSGIAGIAASIRLAAKGYRVEVFEANSCPGGKLSEIRLGDYRFDAGPSLFTLPLLVDELFELCGKNPRQYFSYVRLDEITRYFYDDGTQITAFANPARFAEEIEQKTGESALQVEKFLSKSKEMYELTAPVFLHHSLHRLKIYFSRHTIRALSHIHKIDLWHTMNQFNQLYFNDARIVTLFNRFATYNGSDLFQAPAILNLIPHLEHNIGAFFPTEGMYAITQSLYKLARSMGVLFYFNTRIDKISHDGNKAKGVVAAGEKHEADLVVCNMDITHAYRKLLPDIKEPASITNQSKSSSGIVFYWGIRKEFPELHLHNIFFSSNYKKEFEYIFKKRTVYSDPTVYINITSKLKKDDAPKGCENWFVMINVPHNCGQNWSELIPKLSLGKIF